MFMTHVFSGRAAMPATASAHSTRVPRSILEWFLPLFALSVGISVLICPDDTKLGAYVLWSPLVTVHILRLAWAVAFWVGGISQLGAILWCHLSGPACEGVCTICPIRGTCKANVARRYTATYNIFLWFCLGMSLISSGVYVLVSPIVILFLGQLYVYGMVPNRRGLREWIS